MKFHLNSLVFLALLKLINWLLTFIRILRLNAEIRAFEEIAQTRIGGLLQISKHRKKLKIRGKAVFFDSNELQGLVLKSKDVLLTSV